MGHGQPFAWVQVTRLEAWAPGRLQYDYKVEWQVELRKQLTELLRRLSRTHYLHARLSSADPRGDLENLLFYNVGLPAFSHLELTSLDLERAFSLPSEVEAPEGMTHHWLYASAPQDAVWMLDELVASWGRLPLPGKFTGHDCAPYWAAVRAGIQAEAVRRWATGPDAKLGLELVLHGDWRSAPTELVKPLVDGALSAFGPQRAGPSARSRRACGADGPRRRRGLGSPHRGVPCHPIAAPGASRPRTGRPVRARR